jgi:hypothetical protein
MGTGKPAPIAYPSIYPEENHDKIKSTVEMTEKGSAVTRTSTDAKVVTALQGHAAEVTELAQEGMVAMRRGMMASNAMRPRGPRADWYEYNRTHDTQEMNK